MVKKRVSKNGAENIFAALRKNGRQKPFWTGIDTDKNRCFSRQYYPREHQRRVVDPGVFNKKITLLGIAGYKMIITNSALRASLVIYHFISSAHLVE